MHKSVKNHVISYKNTEKAMKEFNQLQEKYLSYTQYRC